MTKTIGAIMAVIADIVIFIACFRMVLHIAEQGHDPGAYFMLGGLCFLVILAGVFFLIALSWDRNGHWDTLTTCEHGCRTQEEWLTKHGYTWR